MTDEREPFERPDDREEPEPRWIEGPGHGGLPREGHDDVPAPSMERLEESGPLPGLPPEGTDGLP